MFRWKLLLRGLLVMLLVASFVACGNDDDDNDDTDNTADVTMEFPTTTVATVPPTVAQNAPEVIAFQSFSNSLAAWTNYVTAAGEPIDGGTQWTTTDPTTGDEITITAVESGGGTKWTIQLNGVTLWVGEVSADGNSATWTLYDPTGQNVQATYTAEADGNGGITFEFSTTGFVYTGTVNADGSGSVVMMTNEQKTLEAQWNADGSGKRTIYGPGGNVISEQFW